MRVLEPGVTPFVFPPITVDPDEFVSSALIDAILSQEGLIYLLRGYSGKSFWVAFERDYGHRSRRRVFSFDPQTARVSEEDGPPRDVHVSPSCARRDWEHVSAIIDYMKRERFFQVWFDCPVTGDPETVIRRETESILDKGGYVVLFWSTAAANSPGVAAEMESAWRYKKNQILVALLEDMAPPPWLESDLPGCYSWCLEGAAVRRRRPRLKRVR